MQSNAPQTLYAKANGMELAYDCFGDPSAPPLVLIMGLGTQMIAWDESFCAQLAARGYYVVRFDNRDIGLSTKLHQAKVPNVTRLMALSMLGLTLLQRVPYTLADMANDTVGLMDALGIASAHIVGASMGGAIAQEVALRYGERVRTMTSIMSTSGARGLPPPSPEAMAVLTSPTPTDRAGYIARSQRAARALRNGHFPEEDALDEARAIRAYDRSVNPAGFTRQLAAIIASGSRRDRLKSLRTPTLVIHGDADPLVHIACGRDVAQHVPGAKMVTVPRMGHTLPRWAWPQIIDAIAAHAV
ncbi:MAG: alpha/beta hydrolase [Acidovorax sp.]